MTTTPKCRQLPRILANLAPRLVLRVGPCSTDLISATLDAVDGAFEVARQRIARKGRQP